MRSCKGFTAIELVLGIVVGVAVALVAYVMLEPVRNFAFTEARRAGTNTGEVAMLRMVKEIGRINQPSQITTHTATQLSFVDYDTNAITYQLSGTDILRNGNVLASGVQSLAFEYLDEDGIVTAIPADMRIITVELNISVGDQVVRLRSAERIRNIP